MLSGRVDFIVRAAVAAAEEVHVCLFRASRQDHPVAAAAAVVVAAVAPPPLPR